MASLIKGKQIALAPDGIATGNLNANAVTPAKADLTQVWAFTANPTFNADPILANDLVRKSYVDSIAAGGRLWKELLLVSQQLLPGGSAGILQAESAFIATNPSNNDTFKITDGSTTETFTFKTSPAGAFQVQIGGSASATQTNLISQINTDSVLWSAIATSGLDKYFGASPAAQMVVYRKVATVTANDRLYGTLTAPTGIKVFAYTGNAYATSDGSEISLPAADPAVKQFGFGRVFAGLGTSETHITTENSETFTWDADDQVWQETDVGAVVAGAGLSKTGNTLSVLYGTPGSIQPDDAATAGAANTAARSDHTHAIAAAVAGPVQVGDSAAEGSALAFARADHVHSVASAPPVNVGASNVEGVATSPARSDHVHATPRAAIGNKNMVASVTTTDNDQATATTVSTANALASYMSVRVNGLHYAVGNGTKVAVDTYFSNDGGTTARTFSAVQTGDTLHWNGSVAGFQLAASDRIDIDYDSFF